MARGLIRDAVISDDERYRYSLYREVNQDGHGTALFVMLNPSTADAYQDDPTIRRVMGFAKSWGRQGVYVANLYAIRATNPSVLPAVADPIGPENDIWLRRLEGMVSNEVVAAWGANKYADPDRIEWVNAILGARRTVHCLGRTAKGSPRHPLYVKGDTPLVIYRAPA